MTTYDPEGKTTTTRPGRMTWTVSDHQTAFAQGFRRKTDAYVAATAEATRGIVAALSEVEPIDEGSCIHCEEWKDSMPGSKRAFVPHSEDCLWRSAKQALLVPGPASPSLTG